MRRALVTPLRSKRKDHSIAPQGDLRAAWGTRRGESGLKSALTRFSQADKPALAALRVSLAPGAAPLRAWGEEWRARMLRLPKPEKAGGKYVAEYVCVRAELCADSQHQLHSEWHVPTTGGLNGDLKVAKLCARPGPLPRTLPRTRARARSLSGGRGRGRRAAAGAP